ncbi:MAG TPA: hypothetical protein VGI88_06410 [Verrucomicrobiae bacterium]
MDYEIFGNGAGDVRQHVIDPTARMARLCEKYGAPLTVFFEVEEYLAFERHRTALVAALGYDPAGLIREQIVSLARSGHDIQLHLHPQWCGAVLKDGTWILRGDKRTVDSLFETQEETDQYIAERKAVIDQMLAEAGRREKVTVYRAGAFSAQPGTKLLPALARNGFVIDSSVVKGLVQDKDYGSGLDYRGAPSAKEPWRVSRDVIERDADGPIWEVPIYSRMRRRFQQLTVRRLRAKFSKNIPKAQKHDMVQKLGIGKNPVKILKFLAQPIPIKLDFHNQSPHTMLNWIKSAPAPANDGPDVVVLIGHTKEHTDDRAFEKLLALAKASPGLKVSGFGEIARLLRPETNGRDGKSVQPAASLAGRN